MKRTAVLLVGPRGAGKTTWATKIAQQHPEVTVFDRDKFLQDKFPGLYSPYSGIIYGALNQFWQMVQETVSSSKGEIFIFDYFTDSEKERADLVVKELRRRLGFELIYAHVLTTSRENAVKWFLEREKECMYSQYAIELFYDRFWRAAGDVLPADCESEHSVFDGVRLIDPDERQLILPHMPLV